MAGIPNPPLPPDPLDDTSGVLTPEFAALTYKRKLAILLCASLVTGVEISNRLSLNVILPDMQGNVAADSDQISWVLTLYNAGFMISMILTPWMTRLFGARRHYTICAGLYSLGAIGCFLSSRDLTLLLVSRFVMGLGGGFFLVRLVIMAGLFFPGTTRLVPMTWAYLVLFSMQLFYPVAIGSLADNFHWNYAFLLDLPFLAVGIFLLRRVLPPGHMAGVPPRRQTEDYWGAALMICSMITLQIATSRGERDLWFDSPLISSTFVIAIASFLLFIWWELKSSHKGPAVLHLRHVMSLPTLRNALWPTMMLGALLGAGLYTLPQYLRTVQDFSSTQTGEFFSAFCLGLGLGCIITLRVISPSVGPWWAAMIGFVSLGFTFLGFIYVFTPTTPTTLLIVMLMAQGITLGITLVGVAGNATGQLTANDLWEGDTTYFFIRQLGNTFGVTAVTIFFDRRMTFHSARMLDQANAVQPVVSSTLAAYTGLVQRSGGATSEPAAGALQIFRSNILTQTRVLSFVDVSFFLLVLCAIGIVTVLLMRRTAAPSTPSCVPPNHI